METVLVINPGSTSTKLALFANHDCLAEETLRHSVQELALKMLSVKHHFETNDRGIFRNT